MAAGGARRWVWRLGAAALAVYILVLTLQRPRDAPRLAIQSLDEPRRAELAKPSHVRHQLKRPESQVKPPSLCGPGSSWVHCFQPIRLRWPGGHGPQATEAAPHQASPGGPDSESDAETEVKRSRDTRRRGGDLKRGEGDAKRGGGDLKRGEGDAKRGGQREGGGGGGRGDSREAVHRAANSRGEQRRHSGSEVAKLDKHPPPTRDGGGSAEELAAERGGRHERVTAAQRGRPAAAERAAMAEECKDEEAFCLRDVLDAFRRCLDDKGEVRLDEYEQGWKGLVKFMNSLGTMFSFISSDAVSKLNILEAYRKGPNANSYRSLQAMARFESEAGDLVTASKRDPPSGCRTFLRLHRALLWLRLFLERLRTSGEGDRPSAMCSEAYDQSLSQHHPWIVRQASSVAFRLLPTRSAFFEVMHVGTEEQVVAMLGEAVPAIEKVYDVSEAVYVQHNMLDLP